MEEKDRKSQMVVVGFNLFLTTKPTLVKFEAEGTATLTGKDAEINKMLEIDPETKVPYVFQKVYQNAFAAMYLLSTILNAPAPPHNLFFSQREGVPTEDVTVESRVGEAVTEGYATATEGVTVETKGSEEKTEERVEERKEESSNMERGESGVGEAASEGQITATEDITAEPRSEETVTERHVEERTE